MSIDELEAPLRAAHAASTSKLCFSDFVWVLLWSKDHALHKTAIEYDRQLRKIQNPRGLSCENR